MIAVMSVLLLIGLIGCSSGTSAEKESEKTSSAQPKKLKPLTVYPEAGHKRGVIQSGVTALYAAGPDKGLTYRCRQGLKSVMVLEYGSFNYNGTVVRYDSAYSHISDSVNRIRVAFDDKVDTFSQKVVSMIFHTRGVTTEKWRYNVDELVVNLTPEMIERGIKMNISGLGFVDSIPAIEFCLRK